MRLNEWYGLVELSLLYCTLNSKKIFTGYQLRGYIIVGLFAGRVVHSHMKINYNRKSNGKLELYINRIARLLVNYCIIS